MPLNPALQKLINISRARAAAIEELDKLNNLYEAVDEALREMEDTTINYSPKVCRVLRRLHRLCSEIEDLIDEAEEAEEARIENAAETRRQELMAELAALSSGNSEIA